MILSRYITFNDKFTSVSANTALVNALLLIMAQAPYPLVPPGRETSINKSISTFRGGNTYTFDRGKTLHYAGDLFRLWEYDAGTTNGGSHE